MLPLYQTYLALYLSRSELLMFSILINLLQIHKWVRLESLANRLPLTIKFGIRRKRLQRFLSLKVLDVEKIWFPLLEEILNIFYFPKDILYIVMDRTQWNTINIFMVSLIYKNRALPIYFQLLDKKGSSSVTEQIEILSKIMPLFKNYKKVRLGDRKFCGVGLAKWLKDKGEADFVLRIKKNEYFLEKGEWKSLKALGLKRGMSLYFQGVKVTKSQGFGEFNIVAKWQRNYHEKKVKEPGFLLTNINSLTQAVSAYQKRMGIEEMFRDFKKGGYNLEATQLEGKRLLSLLLLITFAYTQATLSGDILQSKGVANYVGRPKEAKRQTRRHSRFYMGLHGQDWLDSLDIFAKEVEELVSLSPQKRRYYQRGRRAASLIQSVF